MQKGWITTGLLAASFASAATGLASSGHDQGNPHNGKFGPYRVVANDPGSCGNAWAVAREKRVYQIKRNADGSFRLSRLDHGTFRTRAGRSPGACETRSPHGSRVPARKTGQFRGYLIGTISGGTFDPNAACTADCGFTDVFIATHFGANATFSCFEDSTDCTFGYQYHALRQHLKYHHWYDNGTGAGSLLNEKFRGDIAAS
jgi:hypothetical protein